MPPNIEPGVVVPIPPVVEPNKLGVVPNPELPKDGVPPKKPGLVVAADAPPKIGVWPNPTLDGVDVVVPKVGPAGLAPKGDCPVEKNPVPVLP